MQREGHRFLQELERGGAGAVQVIPLELESGALIGTRSCVWPHSGHLGWSHTGRSLWRALSLESLGDGPGSTERLQMPQITTIDMTSCEQSDVAGAQASLMLPHGFGFCVFLFLSLLLFQLCPGSVVSAATQ